MWQKFIRKCVRYYKVRQVLQSETVITKWDVTHMRIKWYHCYVSRFVICHLLSSYVIHSATSTRTITTNLGVNINQNEMVAYLHVTWSSHAKVIKTTAPKFALMKGTHLNRPLIAWYPDKWKEHVVTFTEVFRHQIWYEKTQNIIYLFFRFKIYMRNTTSWNELKLLRG